MTLGKNRPVNLNNYSLLQADIGESSAPDMVNVFGGLNLDPGSSLNLLSLAGAFDGSTYTLATYDTLAGTQMFGTVTVDGADTLASKNYTINYGPTAITLSAIPEPSSFVMLLGGMGLLFLRRRNG